ncbi:hypothetical protein BDB00DRAFT_927127 [Zychaea mexicana]|uniref:uncharacterized protein n=1 Tax=Zychaea mexicana TaxID=64656 RepID=UPI0022FE5AAB|nr:uncharacterized protein BDB00DRAFT_927127 [Zychaea mexicana]KAI9495765.1 hypothetical protein BDB00DRAFT_927127 [Zychaea mexicana]
MLQFTLLNSLPPEILSLIAAALPLEDCHAGMLICKAWSTEFTAAFYRSVTLRTKRQCDLFYNNALLFNDDTGLALSGNITRTYGHYIREIHILAPDPPPAMLKQLPRLCPLLTRFELPDTIRGDIHDLGSVPLHYTTLPALTHISLVSGLADFSWLKALPRLVFLNINWVGAGCSIKSILGTIHTWCPRLETLKLTINSASTPTLQRETNDVSVYDKHNQQLNTRSAALSEEDNQSAPTMQSVQLCLSMESANTIVATWLTFCAQKYPNLRQLALNMDSSYTDDGSRLGGENVFFSNGTNEGLLLSSIVQVTHHCRHLQSVEFQNFAYSEFFLRSISRSEQYRQQQQLTSINIKDQHTLFSSDVMLAVTSWFQNSLTTLSLAFSHYPYSNLDLNHNAILQHLHQLRQLCSLTLEGLSSIPVDMLLDAMPQLKHVCLVVTYPEIVRNATTTASLTTTVKKHDLEILEFKRNIVPLHILEFVNQRCLSLRQLNFERVSIKPSPTRTTCHGVNNYACSNIFLPNLDLKQISLRNVSSRPFILQSSLRIGVIQTSISSDVCKWYETGKLKIHHAENTNTRNISLGYTASLSTTSKPAQEDHTQGESPDNVVFSLLIKCRSLDQIYFNDMRLIL